MADRSTISAVALAECHHRRSGPGLACDVCNGIARRASEAIAVGRVPHKAGNPRPKRASECHPDRPRRGGGGLCSSCYAKARYEDGKAVPPTKRAQARYSLMRNYGLSIEDYDQMVKDQGGRCLICTKATARLVVDHDHITGRVRGLLCHKCNTGIGLLGDSEELLSVAIGYLRASE